MLTFLRAASKGWVSKILLLLLILSFAVWGVAGQMGGGLGGSAVVTAGATKVSPVEYRLAYNRQVNVLSQRFGQQLSVEQARLLGVESQVIQQLVGGAVLDEQARVMKLGLSEDRLAALIAEDQSFQGLTGQFDRAQFTRVLANVGMSETDYIESREKFAMRQQIIEATTDGMNAPETFLSALFEFQGQTRDVRYITVDESTLGEIAAPDDADLTTYFVANKDNYRAPEYRSFKMVKLTTDLLLDSVPVSDEDVRAEYDANLTRYSVPEMRTIQQLVFPDKAAADAALAKIRAGQSFEDAVIEAGRKMEDVTLGTFEKVKVPDQKLAEAAFALPDTNSVSDVLDGTFGPILVHVSQITTGSTKAFAEVSDEIRRDLARVAAGDIILNVHDGYEDARAAGSTIEEAAAAQKLDVVTIEAVDREGLDMDGKPIDLGVEKDEIIDAVFSAEIETENPPLNAGRDGFIWYEVSSITPERDRTLDEVRDEVAANWLLQEKSNQLDAEATRLVEAVKAGGELATLAEEKNYPIDSKFGLTRTSDDADFGSNGVSAVFSVGPNGVAFSKGATGNNRLVFEVTAISSPLGGADTLQPELANTVTTSLQSDLLDQMVNRLQLEFPASVNQTAIQQAIEQR